MRQEELFAAADVVRAAERPRIPGFRLECNYLTPDEERDLVACVDAGGWQTDWRRRIQLYGLGYGSGGPRWVQDFPPWLLPLARRVTLDGVFERFPENCVINEYVPPIGIGPHLDYPVFGPVVACVSLCSDIVVDFREPDGMVRVPVHVPSRSLWVITGEARWKWTHGIAHRFADNIDGERHPRTRRISITFRTAKDPRIVSLPSQAR